jgi:hypothetical protein
MGQGASLPSSNLRPPGGTTYLEVAPLVAVQREVPQPRELAADIVRADSRKELDARGDLVLVREELHLRDVDEPVEEGDADLLGVLAEPARKVDSGGTGGQESCESRAVYIPPHIHASGVHVLQTHRAHCQPLVLGLWWFSSVAGYSGSSEEANTTWKPSLRSPILHAGAAGDL